jgi:hypothetical protein
MDYSWSRLILTGGYKMAIQVTEMKVESGVVVVQVTVEETGKGYQATFDPTETAEGIVAHFQARVFADLAADDTVAKLRATVESGLAAIDVSAKITEIGGIAEEIIP